VTDDERTNELSDETIEDLEAPAASQSDVAGGADGCAPPTCMNGSKIRGLCNQPSCQATALNCTADSHYILVQEH
jgi:hypothetical protein